MAQIPSEPRNDATKLSPFKGWPPTKVVREKDGVLAYRVYADALTPLRARIANYVAAASGATMVALGLYGMWQSGNFDLETLCDVGVISVTNVLIMRLGLGHILKRGVRVIFSEEKIVIRSTYSERSFERAYPHAFALLPHDKAAQEKERHAFLERKRPPKWWSLQRKKYYGKSYHVVLTHLGERHDILSVYGHKRAARIQARLQACDAVVSGGDFGDSGVALSPEKDWATNAGGF